MPITRNPKRRRRLPKNACPFCKSKIQPDYKNFDQLSKYLSERGRIVGRMTTGTCAKHQRMLAIEIKRAQHLSLLKYSSRV